MIFRGQLGELTLHIFSRCFMSFRISHEFFLLCSSSEAGHRANRIDKSNRFWNEV